MHSGRSLFTCTLLAILSASVDASKSTELSILAMIPITGKEPANGKACIAAMQIVADQVNLNSDILPNFHVTLNIQDEARNANRASLSLVRYLDPYLQGKDYVTSRNEIGYLSPVISGPSITCQYVNAVAKHLAITQFSQFCAGPYLVNRKLLPNLFRVQIPGEYSVIAILLFMQNVGKWRQMAIFTYSLNVNEYMMANTLKSTAEANGIKVLHYHNEDDVTLDQVLVAKASGARVFALIYLQVAMCVRFLCHSYMAGMRAPQYVFLPQIFCYFTPNSSNLTLPEGCTREMIYEQMKITYWTGIPQTNPGIMAPLNTTLDYSFDWFEREIQRRLNYTIPPDYDQRHLCHDTMMANVVTLDKGERILNNRYNMSLRDFRSQPRLVASIFNESATKLDFTGIRIGQIKYSNRFELAQEDMWIMQWSNGSLRRLCKVTWNDMEDQSQLYNTSLYKLEVYSQPIWLTKYGHPPKDLSNISIMFYGFTLAETSVIAVLAGSVTIIEVALPLFAGRMVKVNQAKFSRLKLNWLFALGLILTNSGAVILVVGGYSSVSRAYCKLRVVAPVLGVSIIDAAIFMRGFFLAKLTVESGKARVKSKTHPIRSTFKQNVRHPALAATRSVPVPRISVNLIEAIKWRQIDRQTFQVAILALLINALLLIGWLAGPSGDYSVVNVTSPIFFDDLNDSFYRETSLQCSSNFEVYWLSALVCSHALLLLIGCMFAYQLGKGTVGKQFQVESTMSRVAIANSTSIYTGVVMIVCVLAGNFTLQSVVLALGLLTYSISNGALWFYPAVISRQRRSNWVERRVRFRPSATIG